jgi:hypothetical protein
MSIMNVLHAAMVRTNAVDIICGAGTSQLARRIRSFSRGEGGVVTVEWVAVAAAVTLGAISIAFIIMNGLVTPSQNIANQLSP